MRHIKNLFAAMIVAFVITLLALLAVGIIILLHYLPELIATIELSLPPALQPFTWLIYVWLISFIASWVLSYNDD